jgi:hypothetical protein
MAKHELSKPRICAGIIVLAAFCAAAVGLLRRHGESIKLSVLYKQDNSSPTPSLMSTYSNSLPTEGPSVVGDTDLDRIPDAAPQNSTQTVPAWRNWFYLPAIHTVAACVYLAGYAIARWQGVLDRHMIGNIEAQHYWISYPLSSRGTRSDRLKAAAATRLIRIYEPLCKAEGAFWTRLLSEEMNLQVILPSR